MSVDTADTTDDDATDTADDRFEDEIVAMLRGLGEEIEPWKLRPPENLDDPAKLLVGARPGIVCGRLEGAGYDVRELELPVECKNWVGAWEVIS